ncbi:small integral membrane protein 12 [Colletes latitarsis]|uniref:small integral membrane protein 12 n=1 Tax=Colletes latitarsis TaxID=2605962 RepID=UPI0040368C9D
MWPLLGRVLSRYGTKIQLPIVCVIGFIGYHIEGLLSDRYTPMAMPVKQQRDERLLEDIDSTPGKKGHQPLEINLPPSLSMLL